MCPLPGENTPYSNFYSGVFLCCFGFCLVGFFKAMPQFFEPFHAYGILVLQPVIEPGPPAVKAQNP